MDLYNGRRVEWGGKETENIEKKKHTYIFCQMWEMHSILNNNSNTGKSASLF